jgi:Co/Zn/Cd efflux system component
LAFRYQSHTLPAVEDCYWENRIMTTSPVSKEEKVLLRRGRGLEWFTLGWNLIGVIVLAVLAITASTVVLWELSGAGEPRQRRALRLIGVAFVLLVVYLLAQSLVALFSGHHASPSIDGLLAVAVLLGVTLDLLFGWWWADPVAGLVIVYYAIREAIYILQTKDS